MGIYDKYKNKINEEQDFKKKQRKLHKKHDKIPEDTVIIEKNGTMKIIVGLLRAIIRKLFGLIVIALATIGILTLIYPETRAAFAGVIQMIKAKTGKNGKAAK